MRFTIYRRVVTWLFLLVPAAFVLPAVYGESVLHPGDRVKVEYEVRVTEKLLYVIPIYSHNTSASVTGTLSSLSSDSLVLVSDLSNSSTSFSLDEIKSLRVSTGRRRATFDGLWKGAAIGAVLGGLLVMADPALDEERIADSVVLVDNSPSDEVVFGGTLAAGTIIGATIGYFTMVDVWQKIEPGESPIHASLFLNTNRIGMSLSYRF
jgi:hypothetical protein